MATTQSSWQKIGHSKTSPVKNTARKQVEVKSTYGLVVGFEVNHPEAFVNDVQNLSIDFGHAFFYLTKNSKVIKFFSFGPNGAGEEGKILPARANERPGTPDYPVSEPTKLFRLKLTKQQSAEIDKETDKIRKQIIDGKQKYTAYMNDTCAETARDIIKATIPSIPDGSGKITMAKHTTFFNVTNPYMWHKNFKLKKYTEYPLKSIHDEKLFPGVVDPLAKSPFEAIK